MGRLHGRPLTGAGAGNRVQHNIMAPLRPSNFRHEQQQLIARARPPVIASAESSGSSDEWRRSRDKVLRDDRDYKRIGALLGREAEERALTVARLERNDSDDESLEWLSKELAREENEIFAWIERLLAQHEAWVRKNGRTSSSEVEAEMRWLRTLVSKKRTESGVRLDRADRRRLGEIVARKRHESSKSSRLRQ